MTYQPLNDRRSSTMRVLTYSLVAILLVILVYSVDIGASVRNRVEIVKEIDNDGRSSENTLWTYTCDNKCARRKLRENEQRVTLETCNELCSTPPLWPKPKLVQVTQKNSSTFIKNHVVVKLLAPSELLEDLIQASGIFMNNLPYVAESWLADVDVTNFNIYLNVISNENKLKISTNESYNLLVKNIEGNIIVNISAPTYFGARHGLETLSQLIWLDTDDQKLRIIHDVDIYDSPTFPHRGLMVDTARNYFPIEQLQKVLDGMAATKLNVFHMHLTDSVSFPVILPQNKKFAEYGAYSADMVYTPDDIKGLVEYARIRGIRVVLETDAPSHTNEGWNQEANLVICGEDDVLNGHLNPVYNETLNILESVYEDLLDLGTDSDMFHIGGDEVNLTCWNEAAQYFHYTDLKLFWADFTNKIFNTVKSANKNKLPDHIVLWSSPLTDSYINKLSYKENLVVQYWYGSISPILRNRNKIIFSTVGRWYLDCGFGPWKPSMTNGVCDPYTPWQTFYKYRPWSDEFPSYIDQVLGGEACLWTEQVEVDSLETRIWPRAAALAERLWTDPSFFDDYDVFTRLDTHRNRLKSRGIKTAAMWPRWCSQNPGKC